VIGNVWSYCKQDPAVNAAISGSTDQGVVFEYISQQKARQELPISAAMRAAVPDRNMYIFYHTDGIRLRNTVINWNWKNWDGIMQLCDLYLISQ